MQKKVYIYINIAMTKHAWIRKETCSDFQETINIQLKILLINC